MANALPPKNRYLVPNFRSFRHTVSLGEIAGLGVDRATRLVRTDFDERVAAWRRGRALGVAGDVLSAAQVSGGVEPDTVNEAAGFVIEHAHQSPQPLLDAARRALGHRSQVDTTDDGVRRHFASPILDEHERRRTYENIHSAKRAVRRFGNNAVIFTELARLYLTLGNEERATRNVEVALALAPNNRYILRSAARTFAHCGDAERGFELLMRSPRVRRDPWLTSAALAMAGVIGRSSKVMKTATGLLKSGDFSPLSLAELRAGVGSVELLAGNQRRAKRLLRASLEQPTDNSLAQVEWGLSVEPLFELDLSTVDATKYYEALALEAYENRRWTDVVEHCKAWLWDMPFASRPVLMASHVATVVLGDYEVAQAFCRAGRLVARNDPKFINNYAYALGLNNQGAAALEMLDEVPAATVKDSATRACLYATRGLAYFRRGDVARGREMYELAMEMTSSMQDKAFGQVAVLNYVREELLAGHEIPAGMEKHIRSLKIGQRSGTTEVLKEKVVALLTVPGGARGQEGRG